MIEVYKHLLGKNTNCSERGIIYSLNVVAQAAAAWMNQAKV